MKHAWMTAAIGLSLAGCASTESRDLASQESGQVRMEDFLEQQAVALAEAHFKKEKMSASRFGGNREQSHVSVTYQVTGPSECVAYASLKYQESKDGGAGAEMPEFKTRLVCSSGEVAKSDGKVPTALWAKYQAANAVMPDPACVKQLKKFLGGSKTGAKYRRCSMSVNGGELRPITNAAKQLSIHGFKELDFQSVNIHAGGGSMEAMPLTNDADNRATFGEELKIACDNGGKVISEAPKMFRYEVAASKKRATVEYRSLKEDGGKAQSYRIVCEN